MLCDVTIGTGWIGRICWRGLWSDCFDQWLSTLPGNGLPSLSVESLRGLKLLNKHKCALGEI